MNSEDMSEMIQKLSSMMNESENENVSSSNNSDISSNLNGINFENMKNILSNINLNSGNNEQDNNSQFDFDIETILKLKKVMDAVQSSKNSPEANLLLSLKPYLNNNRKQKLDQYMQFLNITKVLEAFNSNGGASNQ